MELNLRIPRSIYLALNILKRKKETTLLVELATSLYQRGILSFGKARELANCLSGTSMKKSGAGKLSIMISI